MPRFSRRISIHKSTTIMKSFNLILGALLVSLVNGCLITNCPRGGKRNGKFGLSETNVKPCVSCGPGHLGQCFGSNICCGRFGCLINTPETIQCQREGFFHEQEPCIAGSGPCRKNTGRCALDGVCCTQESCHMDKSCAVDDKAPLDLYGLISSYQNEYGEK